MTSPDLEALKALVAKWREQAKILETGVPDFSDGLAASRTECANDLEKALSRLLASQGKPEAEAASQEPSSGEDWVMVPREPRDRMLSAAQIAGAGRALTNAEIYRAMLSAGEADWDVETAGIRHKLPKLD